ncbi:hypothetical protein BBB56_12885 [Candidatus Pantoea deserta]|uniref:Uncharacterized protein n=1 Tax=Candidatus Pantoea deserta TaxID=1869313 RepID=A0A3N4NZV1_9GAMM|nr:hypothetical protein [Pantoea deserta]RPD99738.1 hypothetical protein BBB56_12885 [Pantoea deserta]
MLFHNDEKGHAVIGEAVVSLALGEKEISVDTLIAELGLMAETETCAERLSEISEARRWLQGYQHYDTRDQPGLHWLTVAGQDDEGRHSEDVIRLRPENDDER